MTEEQEIVTHLPESFLREFEAEVLGQIPAEKVKADLDSVAIKKVLINEGATCVEGLGQKLGEIPARVYFRWLQEQQGCWQDKGFVNEFFKDNPQLKADGWTPKTNAARHGMTYVGGEAIRVK